MALITTIEKSEKAKAEAEENKSPTRKSILVATVSFLHAPSEGFSSVISESGAEASCDPILGLQLLRFMDLEAG